jgi:hypothetical protein
MSVWTTSLEESISEPDAEFNELLSSSDSPHAIVDPPHKASAGTPLAGEHEESRSSDPIVVHVDQSEQLRSSDPTVQVDKNDQLGPSVLTLTVMHVNQSKQLRSTVVHVAKDDQLGPSVLAEYERLFFDLPPSFTISCLPTNTYHSINPPRTASVSTPLAGEQRFLSDLSPGFIAHVTLEKCQAQNAPYVIISAVSGIPGAESEQEQENEGREVDDEEKNHNEGEETLHKEEEEKEENGSKNGSDDENENGSDDENENGSDDENENGNDNENKEKESDDESEEKENDDNDNEEDIVAASLGPMMVHFSYSDSTGSVSKRATIVEPKEEAYTHFCELLTNRVRAIKGQRK